MRQSRVVSANGKRLRAIRGFGGGIKVVNDDQVDITGGGHFSTAEPAHSDDAGATSRNVPVLCLEICFDGSVHMADEFFGDERVGRAGLVSLNQSGQQANTNQEHLLAADDAGSVENALQIRCSLQL